MILTFFSFPFFLGDSFFVLYLRKKNVRFCFALYWWTELHLPRKKFLDENLYFVSDVYLPSRIQEGRLSVEIGCFDLLFIKIKCNNLKKYLFWYWSFIFYPKFWLHNINCLVLRSSIIVTNIVSFVALYVSLKLKKKRSICSVFFK